VTFTRAIGVASQYVLDRIVRSLALAKIHPNVLTALGLVINIVAAVLFGRGKFFQAGLVVVGAGVFDMVDGRVARASNTVTPFGAFFDSVVDRYSDMALYMGLLVYYARIGRSLYVVLVALVMAGSVMISYTRARAESLIPSCKVGFLERPERIVLIIIGALTNRMAPVLWLIGVFSNVTVVHRCVYTWRETQRQTAPSHESLLELPLASLQRPAKPHPRAEILVVPSEHPE